MNPITPDNANDMARMVSERVVFFLWLHKLIQERSGGTASELMKEIEGVVMDALIVGK